MAMYRRRPTQYFRKKTKIKSRFMTEEQAALAADLSTKIRVIDEYSLPQLQCMIDKLAIPEETRAKVVVWCNATQYTANVELSRKIVKMCIDEVQKERQELISRLEHI